MKCSCISEASISPSTQKRSRYTLRSTDQEGIGPVLHDLKAGHYIALDVANNVTITEIGLSRLRAAMF